MGTGKLIAALKALSRRRGPYKLAYLPSAVSDMARKGEDPMSSLLSNVGGIDSSLFQKPQSMRDMRPQGSPVRKDAERPQSKTQLPQKPAETQPAYKSSPPLARSSERPSASAPSRPLKASNAHAQAPSDSNRQLDALLGGGVFSKAGRCGL